MSLHGPLRSLSEMPVDRIQSILSLKVMFVGNGPWYQRRFLELFDRYSLKCH